MSEWMSSKKELHTDVRKNFAVEVLDLSLSLSNTLNKWMFSKEELHTDVRKNFAVEAPVLLLNADPDVAET